MKIIDCFIYNNEDLILDLRLNTLDQYVDKFVIVESKFNHSGREKNKFNFDKNKFEKFSNKIEYLKIDKFPSNLSNWGRENFQRNYISNAFLNFDTSDYVIISDVDEIPNLENINFNEIKNKIILFNQKMFYYKFNLMLENISRAPAFNNPVAIPSDIALVEHAITVKIKIRIPITTEMKVPSELKIPSPIKNAAIDEGIIIKGNCSIISRRKYSAPELVLVILFLAKAYATESAITFEMADMMVQSNRIIGKT